MIKNIEHISETRKRLEVAIPADVIEERIRKSLSDLRMKANIPGFRQGKAPLSMIEKKFGSQVESEVLEKVIPEFYAKMIREAGLHPVANPVFEKSDYARSRPLEMTFTVEVMPRLNDLQYEGMRLDEAEVAVTDEDIEGVMMRTRAERVKYESLDRPVEENDLVTVDYDIVEENVQRQGQVIKIGSEQFPRELSEALTGKAKGDSFEVVLTFPGDHPSEFKGKTLTFRGRIVEIKVLVLPEMNDAFAKEMGYADLSEFRHAVGEEVREAKKKYEKKKQIVQLIENLVDTHAFPVPESMLEAELASLLTSAKTKEENKNKSDEILREELLPDATKSAKSTILLNVIGEKENVTVSEEEMKEKIFELSRTTMIPPQNVVQMYLSRDGSLEGLRYGVFREKVAELIYGKAKIEKGA